MSEWLDIDAGWEGSGLLLLAVPPLLAFAYWVYSRTLPAPSRGRAWLLRVLRGTVLAACLLLIAEPFLEIARKQAVRPVLAALLDRSRSMAVEAGGESRISRALDLLRGDRFSRLRRAVRVEALAFSADAEPVSLDTVAATRGEATDISRGPCRRRRGPHRPGRGCRGPAAVGRGPQFRGRSGRRGRGAGSAGACRGHRLGVRTAPGRAGPVGRGPCHRVRRPALPGPRRNPRLGSGRTGDRETERERPRAGRRRSRRPPPGGSPAPSS